LQNLENYLLIGEIALGEVNVNLHESDLFYSLSGLSTAILIQRKIHTDLHVCKLPHLAIDIKTLMAYVAGFSDNFFG
jgi:hypothetical protein